MSAPPILTDLGRRVLGHLPTWWSSDVEAEYLESEGGPEQSVRSYDLPTFTRRLAEDIAIAPPLDESQVLDCLMALKDAGLASDSTGEWRQLKLGYEALNAPVEEEAQVPGAVVVDLHPAEGIAGTA